jgi:hypothetical protein
MGLKDLILGYRKGRDIGNGQCVIQATTVTLAEGAPSTYDENSLKAMCSVVPTGDEHLVLTQDYLIYKTDYQLIEALLNGFEMGANAWGPKLIGMFWEYAREFIDTEDKSFWIPWSEIERIGWNCETFELSSLLGSNVVPFYYYWIELTHGSMWFVQTPIGTNLGTKPYNKMVNALNEFTA